MSDAVYGVLAADSAAGQFVIPIRVAGKGSWIVSKTYVAMHGISGHEVAGLADRYGWPQAPG